MSRDNSDPLVKSICQPISSFRLKVDVPKQDDTFLEAFIENAVDHDHDIAKNELRKTVVTGVNQLRKKPKKKHTAHNLMTCAEKKKLGIYKVEEGSISYSSFRKVHELWKGYFGSVINVDNMKDSHVSLQKADYTGCHFVVAQAKCPNYVGVKGLVVQETRNMFRLIRSDSSLITIPKQGTLFAFTFKGHLFKIYGSYFRKHSHERAKVKFKVMSTIEL